MKRKRIIVFLVLIVAVTGFIFSNSLKNSEESNAASGVFVEVIEPVIKAIFGDSADVSFIVRKGAHLTEFFVLGFWVILTISEIKKMGFSLMGFGFFYVLLVAVTDEFIQSFSDRTSSVSDVFIDFTGALLGFCGYVFLSYCIGIINQKFINKAKR